MPALRAHTATHFVVPAIVVIGRGEIAIQIHCLVPRVILAQRIAFIVTIFVARSVIANNTYVQVFGHPGLLANSYNLVELVVAHVLQVSALGHRGISPRIRRDLVLRRINRAFIKDGLFSLDAPDTGQPFFTPAVILCFIVFIVKVYSIIIIVTIIIDPKMGIFAPIEEGINFGTDYAPSPGQHIKTI